MQLASSLLAQLVNFLLHCLVDFLSPFSTLIRFYSSQIRSLLMYIVQYSLCIDIFLVYSFMNNYFDFFFFSSNFLVVFSFLSWFSCSFSIIVYIYVYIRYSFMFSFLLSYCPPIQFTEILISFHFCCIVFGFFFYFLNTLAGLNTLNRSSKRR